MRSRGLALFLLLWGCTRSAPPTVSHAAIAFRDNVPGYQKFASEQYTVHYLEQGYELVTYLEANDSDTGEARLVAAIEAAASKHDTVDLFFLSHGDHYERWCFALTPAAKAKLRLVYNTGAGNGGQGPTWLSLGARAYVGHLGGSNVAPLFLRHFLPAWVEGATVEKAVADANRETRAELSGTLAQGVSKVVDAVGGPRLDMPKLSVGTAGVFFGDGTLELKR